MEKWEKYKNRWIWWQDISSFFTLFATSFAILSLLISIGDGGEMNYVLAPIIPTIVNLGSIGAVGICTITFVWLIILVVMKAKGTHINQQIQRQDFMAQLSQSKEFTDVLKRLATVLERIEKKLG